MRTIAANEITDTVRGLFLCACIAPQADMMRAVEAAARTETMPRAQEILRRLAENNRIALAENIPACQDTGMAVVMIELGQDARVEGGFLADAVNEGVRRAYREGYFRNSVLDPLTRVNTGDNTPAVIHTEIVPGEHMKITALPKGFGSENMSRIKMLNPSDGKAGVLDFIVETAKRAGGSPCPPVALGIGVGGTFESCALLAKKQLLRRPGSVNPDTELAEMEREAIARINALRMGPMGLGGDTYCLCAHIARQPTHIAALPVAVNYCCHMLRHASAVL